MSFFFHSVYKIYIIWNLFSFKYSYRYVLYRYIIHLFTLLKYQVSCLILLNFCCSSRYIINFFIFLVDKFTISTNSLNLIFFLLVLQLKNSELMTYRIRWMDKLESGLSSLKILDENFSIIWLPFFFFFEFWNFPLGFSSHGSPSPWC